MTTNLLKYNLRLLHRISIVLLFTGLLASCKNSESPSPSTSYQQYGSPFTKVPDRQDAAIYQVNIRAFSQEGTLKGVQSRLDSIKALGVNVVYLMPIYPVGQLRSAGGMGSPYAVRNYKAVNPEFGTLEHLRALVDEAHKRDMAVMLDWVANHTSWDNAWVTAHKDWYTQDAAGNIIIPAGTGWKDVADLNYDNPALRSAMIDAMKYWVYNANIDGFRCDAANYVPNDFWSQAIDSLRGISNHKLLMLAEGDDKGLFKAGFDFIFGFNFFGTLESVYREGKPATLLQNLNTTEYAGALSGTERVVRYISNHDVNLSDGTPLELFGGKQGSLAAFVVAAYMKGVPMIYGGQEIGQATRLQFFSRTPISWSTSDYALEAKYKQIMDVYNSSNAIRRGELRSYSSDDVVAFTKELDGEKVLVLSNLRDRPVTYTVPAALAAASWKNAFSGASQTIGDQVTLQPYEYLVLKN